MAASKFTAELRDELVERFAAGCSVADAARASGVREKTLKHWITKGRSEPESEHRVFVERIEQARASFKQRLSSAVMDEAELAQVVSDAARAGSVQAMKLRWDMLKGKPAAGTEATPTDPLAGLDELAERRATKD